MKEFRKLQIILLLLLAVDLSGQVYSDFLEVYGNSRVGSGIREVMVEDNRKYFITNKGDAKTDYYFNEKYAFHKSGVNLIVMEVTRDNEFIQHWLVPAERDLTTVYKGEVYFCDQDSGYVRKMTSAEEYEDVVELPSNFRISDIMVNDTSVYITGTLRYDQEYTHIKEDTIWNVQSVIGVWHSPAILFDINRENGRIRKYKEYGSGKHDRGVISKMYSDTRGNILINGTFQGYIVVEGDTVRNTVGFHDCYVLRFDSDFNHIKTNSFGGGAMSGFDDFQLHADGSCTVSGYILGSYGYWIDQEKIALETERGSRVIIRYDAEGNLQWYNVFKGPVGVGVKIINNSSEEVYLGVSYEGKDDEGIVHLGEMQIPTTDHNNSILAKMDGETGEVTSVSKPLDNGSWVEIIEGGTYDGKTTLSLWTTEYPLYIDGVKYNEYCNPENMRSIINVDMSDLSDVEEIEKSKDDIILYPTIVREEGLLRVGGIREGATYMIYDSMGSHIDDGIITDERIFINRNLPVGNYKIKIRNADVVSNHTFIKLN